MNLSQSSQQTQTLMSFLEHATSPYHTITTLSERLKACGFSALDHISAWSLTPGGKYFVTPYASCLIAFCIGSDVAPHDGFRIGAAHGDFPGFRVKPQPELCKDGYIRLNTEGYGGVNHMSWLDRPLSLAGKVVLRSDDPFAPRVKLIDFKRPLLTIPNVAVHLLRDMNKGVELKKQTQMLPLLGLTGEAVSDGVLRKLLADELDCTPDEILDYELNVYNFENGCCIGANQDFFQAPRLDDLTSVCALFEALTDTDRSAGINVFVVFDHEEIGSRTKQGADSQLLPQTLKKIYHGLGYHTMQYEDALYHSLMMSVDVAHALHPAYDSHYDPVHKCIPGKGFVIKQACSQSYATDSEVIAIIQQLCDAKQIPYQKFVNHSDERGGGTLGSIAAALLPVRCADIGVPILAMHSARETMSLCDQQALCEFLKQFYS